MTGYEDRWTRAAREGHFETQLLLSPQRLEQQQAQQLGQASPCDLYGSVNGSDTQQLRRICHKNDSNNDSQEQETDVASKTTYYSLILKNIPFRYYLSSYITNHIGEWLTYLAALTAIQEILYQQHALATTVIGDNGNATLIRSRGSKPQTAISILVVVRCMSKVIVSPLGGVLADRHDRRIVMIVLCLLGAVVAFAFVAAVQFQSLQLIYIAAFMQEVLSGLYEPSCTAIIPLLIPNDHEEELEKAVILTSIAWSTVAAFGSALGGFLVSLLGTQGCFVVDSITYVISALLMGMVSADKSFDVSQSPSLRTVEKTVETASSGTNSSNWSVGYFTESIRECSYYLQGTSFGALVLFKFSILWMALDVVNVSFAERAEDESRVPLRLGCLFAAIGLGCLVGPVVAERFTDIRRPETLQVTCLASLAITSISCLCMAIPNIPFWLLCVLNAFRTAGMDSAWVNSELLLQKFSTPQMLGRVLSIDMALALSAESSSAVIAGRLMDRYGFTAEKVCQLLGLLGLLFLLGWIKYHVRGGGIAPSTGT